MLPQTYLYLCEVPKDRRLPNLADASGRWDQASDQIKKCGLSGAVTAYNSQPLSCWLLLVIVGCEYGRRLSGIQKIGCRVILPGANSYVKSLMIGSLNPGGEYERSPNLTTLLPEG